MKIFKLLVLTKDGLVERFYMSRRDAQSSYDRTYTFLSKKPTYKIDQIEVLDYAKPF